jgi:hypothetical protein
VNISGFLFKMIKLLNPRAPFHIIMVLFFCFFINYSRPHQLLFLFNQLFILLRLILNKLLLIQNLFNLN